MMKTTEIKRNNSEKLYLDLIEIRHNQGLYDINELCKMFNVQRPFINFAIESGRLKYMSPNNKQKFIYLNDFIDYMKTKK